MSVPQKDELLFQGGVNFNELPDWQKRGVGLYWERYQKAGVNPMTGASTTSTKRQLKVDYELPMWEAYSQFVLDLLSK